MYEGSAVSDSVGSNVAYNHTLIETNALRPFINIVMCSEVYTSLNLDTFKVSSRNITDMNMCGNIMTQTCVSDVCLKLKLLTAASFQAVYLNLSSHT